VLAAARTLAQRGLAPCFERTRGRGHGGVHVRDLSEDDLVLLPAGGRVEDRATPGGDAAGRPPVDPVLDDCHDDPFA
jgi:hypothetical protein